VSTILPRRFVLGRPVDDNGVSNAGVVAFGIAFPDGHVVLRSGPAHPATSSWDSIDDMLAVHGQDPSTSIQWIDPPMTALEDLPPLQGPGRRARRKAAVIDSDDPTVMGATTVAEVPANGVAQRLNSSDAPPDDSVRSPLRPPQPGRHRRASQVDQRV
jgi:hypothetical protein